MKTDLALAPTARCFCGSGRKFRHCHGPSYEPVRPGAVSTPRDVPSHIGRPPYATAPGGDPGPDTEMPVKPPEVITAMRHAGPVAAEVLDLAGRHVRPGITTDDIDALVHDAVVARGAYPSPLGYKGFRKSVCTSVNEVICHGIPDSRRLRDGDIVSIDVTAYIGGVHGDTCRTFPVGSVDEESMRLVTVTQECLDLGIAAVRPGRPVSDIGRAIQDHAEGHGFSVVRHFVGHGVGTRFHGRPTIFHFYAPDASMVMEPGMTFTIEPMIVAGDWDLYLWRDGWTAVTKDGRRAAQFEHTLVVTDESAEVLTPY